MKRQQLYVLTNTQFFKMAGQNVIPGVRAALDRYNKIRDQGGTPIAFYSEFNGFTVFDDADTSTENIDRISAFKSNSKWLSRI